MLQRLSSKSRTAKALYADMRQAASAGHKSTLRQAIEMAILSRADMRLHPREYLDFNLFRTKFDNISGLTEFVGAEGSKKLNSIFNSIYWEGMQTDKLVMGLLFRAYGIASPRLQAAACLYSRSAGDVKILKSASEVESFLVNQAEFPLFAKPIKGGSSKGSFRAESIDPKTNEISLADGTKLQAAELVARMEDPTGFGYVLQDAVFGHSSTAEMCGDIPSGLRVVTLLQDDGPKIHSATWKIPSLGSHADNYAHGQTGTLMCELNPQTGQVLRVISGIGLAQVNHEDHPVVGKRLVGEVAPFWTEIVDFVLPATDAFSGFRCQHWDLGITSNGVVAYEVNAAGTWDVGQQPAGTGAYNAELKAAIDACGNQGMRWQCASEGMKRLGA